MELGPHRAFHYEGFLTPCIFAFKFSRRPKQIAVLHENMHAYRIITWTARIPRIIGVDGRFARPLGGNTLVVDVANNNDKERVRHGGPLP